MNIYLVEFGQNDIDLELIIQFLNKFSDMFHATWEGRIPYVGEPINKGIFYEGDGKRIYHFLPFPTYADEHIFSLFPLFREPGMTVGIISARLLSNFFIRAKGDNAILFSLWQVDDLCDKAGKTKEDYIVQNIMIYLLWCEYKKLNPLANLADLFHMNTNGCIFDFCQYKPEKVYKLQVGKIEPKCRAKLISAGISKKLLDIADDIFAYIRKYSISDTKNIHSTSNKPRNAYPNQQELDNLTENELRIFVYDHYSTIYEKLTAETSKHEIIRQILECSK